MKRIGKVLPGSTLFALTLFPLWLMGVTCTAAGATPDQSALIVAYIFPQNQLLDASQIRARGISRINYAFANLQNGEVVAGFAHDAENLAVLGSLKHENPALTVVISVGGWAWSNGFSDMASTRKGRLRFINSAVKFVAQYNLDGLDIDWEYPGMIGAGNRFRPEDKQNYTQLLKELRSRFNHEERRLDRHLIISVATGASTEFLEHTEMAKVQRYVDTVNLMTYDYYSPDTEKTTGHHAPLFTNPVATKNVSASQTVEEYLKAGVPEQKICLGVPFYGKAWAGVIDVHHGLFQSADGPAPNVYVPYNKIGGLLSNGFTRYWDSVAMAPYLYSQDSHVFVSYEDVESLKAKCEYVLSHHLGGMMFWEYSGDADGSLLNSMDHDLHSEAQVVTP